MPQHKSAAKRMRTSVVRRDRNRPRISKVRKAVKSLRTAPDKDSAAAGLNAAFSQLDRAASKRAIHKNKANRLKSRLAKAVNAMGS